MAQETIFDQLKKEHREVEELFKAAEECPVSKRASLLHEIEENLVPHARGEEKTLYAVSRKRLQDENKEEPLVLTNEAYEEHHVADNILAELKALDVESERWLPMLKVLKENIEHHVKEEEGSLFKEAKKLFSKEERVEMLDDYLEAKEGFASELPPQTKIDERKPSNPSM